MADLDYEGALRFARAQAQPGTLEQVLGLGVNLPIALAQAKENERRKMSLLQMLQNPVTATPPMPMGVDEAAKLAQIKALLTKPQEIKETPEQKLQRDLILIKERNKYRMIDGVPQVLDIEGVKYVKFGNSIRPLPKGNDEAVKNVSDAINTFSNIDSYFDAIESLDSEVKKRIATSDIPGSGFAFPEVAQAESALLVPFQFASGGKQLTEAETRLIKSMAKQAAFGPEQREAAKENLKKLLRSRIEAQIASGTAGQGRKEIEAKLSGAGIQSTAPVRPSSEEMVSVIAPNGKSGRIPKSKLAEAMKAGYRPKP